jgi:F-type H+-transporting ATPase subunit a
VIFVVAFGLWAVIKFSWGSLDFISSLAHYVPLGSPVGLSFFLCLVEVVRNFIRPVTLSLRLGIKVATGHVLLALISVGSCSAAVSGSIGLIFPLFFGCFYFMFEGFIMLIQAFVFKMLVCQYAKDTL